MGSDNKSKEDEKRKKKISSVYDSEDEGKRKRRRSVKDEEAKSSKSEKKDKIKKKNKSHTSWKHHTDKGKKSKQKSKRDKHDGQSKLKFQVLSTDDYFSKNNEFATWLKEEKNMFFSDLSSESARDLFSQFIVDWNSQKLESRYYEGIETGPRTAHKWRIRQ